MKKQSSNNTTLTRPLVAIRCVCVCVRVWSREPWPWFLLSVPLVLFALSEFGWGCRRRLIVLSLPCCCVRLLLLIHRSACNYLMSV